MEALSFHHLISFTRKNPRFANSLKMKSEFKFEEVLPKLRDVINQIKSTDVPPHSISYAHNNDLLSGCYNMLRFYNQADIGYPNIYVGNTL